MLLRTAVEVRAEFHRLAFHRQVHEEDIEDEAGEEHRECEDEADGVGPHPQIALPRFIHQRGETADEKTRRQGEDDSLQWTRTPRALGVPGTRQDFMLCHPHDPVG